VDVSELHTKATFAAALIASHAVEIPAIPKGGEGTMDPGAIRLRDLTDYVCRAITRDEA